MGARVLLIDNVDSFTYNIADLLHRVLGRAPVVWRHDHPADEHDLAGFAAIVVGPGPGRPGVVADMGLSDLALRQERVPVLGVCLGHQGLAHLHGERVAPMARPRHGIVSEIEHTGSGLFAGLPSPLRVVRYHSLEVVEPLVSDLVVDARALDDGAVMALSDPGARRWGVQFHPESVLSEHGAQLLANFLRLAGVAVLGDGDGPAGAGAWAGDPEDDTDVAVGDTLADRPARGDGRPVLLGARRVTAAVDPWRLHERLVGASPTSVWLDSSDGSGWSLVADSTGPLAHELTHRVGGPQPLLDRLYEALGRWRLVGAAPGSVAPEALPFSWRPGYVGYLGYELKAETVGSAAHRSPWPDAWLTFADRGVVIDHRAGEVWALWLVPAEPGEDRLSSAQRRWADEVLALAVEVAAAGSVGGDGGAEAPLVPAQVAARPRDDEASYREKVLRCLDEIVQGESYEVCLTTTWSSTAADPGPAGESALYRAMRAVSPVPHGAWLRTPEVSVLGCSPERFVRLDAAGTVETRPIKGTRPRGADALEDAALAAELVSSVKDRAENLMIVDLMRNDLHRVCRAGSVHVPEIFAVESYATVHQLVSTVRGRLASGRGATDVLRACFPGGSMTGAPKVRTMEILDRLEGAARGVYSGIVGWIGLDGSMDSSIVIRTATWAHGEVTFGVGGAVTALSDPGQEHAETLTKARSVLTALAVAERAAPPTAVR